MDILIDTNVIIDYADERVPFADAAQRVMTLGETKRVRLCATANTVTDIYYIHRKYVGSDAAREFLKVLFDVFYILPVTGEDCHAALALPMSDYEDSLQAACARSAECACIVTRDIHHFAGSPVPALTPEQFLEEWEHA